MIVKRNIDQGATLKTSEDYRGARACNFISSNSSLLFDEWN